MSRPFRRGLWLALAAAVCMVLAGRIDWMAAYGQVERLYAAAEPADFFLAAAVMLAPGAFLASLPERIRRRKEKQPRSNVGGCAVSFFGGVALMIGAGIAGGGDGLMLTGLLQGSVSAYVFLGVSWLAGLAAARLFGRRKAA